MTDNIVKDCAQKGLSYVIYPKTNLFWLFVNYFAIVLAMKALLTYGANYLPSDLPPDEHAATFSMYAKALSKHFISVLIGLPILVAVAQSILRNEKSSNYFAYFNMRETWRLLMAHVVIFILVGMPTFLLLESFMMTFIYKTPETIALEGPSLALMSLTYMLILSMLFSVVLYFVARFMPLYVHVALGKGLDLGRSFDASRGEAWKIFVTMLVSGLPVMVFTFFTTGNMFFPSSINITRQVQPITVGLGLGFDFMDVLLNATITTVIAFLSIAPFAALCNMYEYLMNKKKKEE